MDSSTAHIASTATGMDIGTARPDKRQLWVDLQAQVHSAKTTQDCDDDAPDQDTIGEIEAELDRYQSAITWQTDLAEAVAQGDEIVRNSRLDAIEAELRRTHRRAGWLADRMKEMQYAEGAQDCDRAVRRMTAIDAVIDGVRARQAQLKVDAIEARAAEDGYGPDANDIDALDAACLA